MNLDQVVARFQQRGFRVKWHGRRVRAQCPGHAQDDSGLHLALDEGDDGRVLADCKSHDCDLAAIAAGVGLKVSDFMPPRSPNGAGKLGEPEAVYPYRDAAGKTLFCVGRFAGKEFRQWREGPQGERLWGIDKSPRVLFGLPELLATQPGDLVVIVEGERDAISVACLGIAATTNPHGAGHWRQEQTDWLRQNLPDRRFVILPDNDEKGLRHAEEVYESLKRAGLNVAVVLLPDLAVKGDVSDWIKGGGTAEKLRELCEPPPHPLVLKLLSRDQLRNLPPPTWQIEGLFYEQSIVEVYGESNHGKSLVGQDIALNMVRGSAWADRPILNAGSVLYVNADGGPGFSPRLVAWEKANGTDFVFEFWTYPMELLIADPRQMHEFTEGLAYLPDTPVMIVIDTLSQCIPGVNENQQEEMSRVVAHLNAIKRRYGTTVMLLHHVGKDGLNRGSTVIPGAADTIIRVTQQPGNLVELRCDKQRDGRKFMPIYFAIEEHGDEEGVYLRHTAGPIGSPDAREEREQQVLDALRVNGGWLTREEVKARVNRISSASVYRYLRNLVEEGVALEDERANTLGAPSKVYLYLQPKEGQEGWT